MIYDNATCYRCGANAWTDCEHRKATRERPVFKDKPDRHERAAMVSGGGRYGFKTAASGLNFKTRKRK